MSKQCPSCGRPIKFEEKYLKVVSCPYCNSVLEFGGGELTKIGEQNAFLDFPSIFQVGQDTIWNGKTVHVKGQLRYEYDGGFYDDFFVVIAGQESILRQDDGSIKKYKILQELNQDIDMESYQVGENGKFGNKDIFIQETGILQFSSLKGYVNSHVIPGKSYQYVDGIIDGHMVHIEKQMDSQKVRIMMEEK